MFNGADQSFRSRPARVSPEDVRAAAEYIRRGAAQAGISNIQIDLHGGEPLLLGKDRFRAVCMSFADSIAGVADLTLCLQTNAMLIDREWIDLFAEYGVRVGVSLDGPALYHDVDRRDFRNRGTYTATIAGLQLLQEAVDHGRLAPVGVLCVIRPARSARVILEHFVDDLGIRTMDFLLPDDTHDSFGGNPDDYGDFLCDLFDAWAERDDPSIQIRILNSVLSLLVGGRSLLSGFGLGSANAITIESDGAVGSDDILRSCGVEWLHQGESVQRGSLVDFLQSSQMQQILGMRDDRSDICNACCWLKVCGSGAMVNRYSLEAKFKNPTVFCPALKKLYARIGRYLIEHGYGVGRIVDTLGLYT